MFKLKQFLYGFILTLVMLAVLPFQRALAEENSREQMEIETVTVTARKQKESIQ